MPTPRESILAGPFDLDRINGIAKINWLFENFRYFAQNHTPRWCYQASGRDAADRQITSAMILDDPLNRHVYCDPLVQAFNELARSVLGNEGTVITQVVRDSCVLQAGLKCIDPDIVGNIKTATKSYAATNQCLFSSKHVYAKIGENYYDPCFLARYPTRDFPVLAEPLLTPSLYEYPALDGWRITKSPAMVFKRNPHGDGGHPGFDYGYTLVENASQLSKQEKEQLIRFCESRIADKTSTEQMRAPWRELRKSLK